MQENITKKEVFCIFIILFFSFFYRLFFISMPLDRDEGTYAYIAERIYFNELPYKDIFDHKQPFIYYIYKIAFDFFGKEAESIRIFTNIYLILLFLIFYSFIRTFLNKWISILSLFLFAIHINNHNFQGLNSNTEIFTLMPIFTSLLLLNTDDDDYAKINFFLSGTFLGIAIFIKFIFIFFLFIPIFYIIFYYKNKIKNILFFLFGFLFLVFIIFFWASKNKILKDFIECNFIYNMNYSNLIFYYGSLKSFIKGNICFLKYNVLLFFGFLYSFYKIFNDKNKIIFLLFFCSLFCYISIFILSGLYPHYYLPLIPFLSVFGALVLDDLIKLKGIKNVLIIILVIGIYLFYYIKMNNFYDFIKSGKWTMNIFYESKIIAQIINDYNIENKKIFVFSNNPEIYFYTHQKAPFRFIYNYPSSKYKDTFDDMLKIIFSSPPLFFITEKIFPDNINNFIKLNYKKIVEFEFLILYKRKVGD